MHDELNKVTTTPETLSDDQMETATGGAGNDAQLTANVGANAVNSALLSANVEACAKNNRGRTNSRIRRLL